MTQKFYLHDASSTVVGTLPSGEHSASTPSVTASGGTTQRTMDGNLGTTQASGALTTLANTSAQPSLFRMFVSAPLAAQTISSGNWTLSMAGSEANANSNLHFTACVYLWRPSTGAVVGSLVFDLAAASTGEPGTSQTAVNDTTISGGSATALAGDVLVCEIWRDATVQALGTAYLNTFFYDGFTEASTSSCASFLKAPADIPILGSGSPFTVTATGGGTVIAEGALLRVRVLTGAAGTQAGHTGTATAAYQVSVTPLSTGSYIYAALCDDGSFTKNANSILPDNTPASAGAQVGSARSTAKTTASTAVTVGATASGPDAGVAALEVQPGTGLAEDPTSPEPASSTTAHVVTSPSFAPPAGSWLVAMVAHVAATTTMSDTSGLGLSWVEAVHITGDGYAGVWLAQMPSGGFTGSSTMSGSGTLSGSPVLAATATMSGAGTLGGAPVRPATAAMSGAGTLGGAPVKGFVSSAAMSGAGTLSGAPVKGFVSTAAMSGSGTLSGTYVEGFPGASAMSGAGTLAGAPTEPASTAMSGSGTLSGAPVLPATTAMSGAGTLGGTPVKGFTATSAMSGAGTLAGAPALASAAALTGAGTLGGSPVLGFPGSAAMSGAGTLSGSYSGSAVGSATLTGSGTLSGTAVLGFPSSAAMSGAGTLSGTGVKGFVSSAAMSGAGTLTGAPGLKGAATMTGLGTMGGQLSSNPVFAGALTTGWTGFNGTLTASASPPAGCPFPDAAQYTNNGVTTGAIEASPARWHAAPSAPYACSAWVFVPVTTSVAIGFDWQNAAGGFLSTTTQTFTVLANTWTYLTTAQTSNAGAYFGYARVGSPTLGVVVWATDIQAWGPAAFPLLLATAAMSGSGTLAGALQLPATAAMSGSGTLGGSPAVVQFVSDSDSCSGTDAGEAIAPPVLLLNNGAAGGAGATVTTGNSGGGSGNSWDAVQIPVGGSLTYDATHLLHQPVSYKFTTGTTAGNNILEWTTQLTPTAIAQFWYRMYLFLPALPSGTIQLIDGRLASTGQATLRLTPAGKITLNDKGGTARATSVTTVPVGQWFRLEGMFIFNLPNGYMEAKLFTTQADEVTPDESLTTPATLNTGAPVNRMDFGNPSSVTSYTFWAADLGVSGFGYLGPSGALITDADFVFGVDSGFTYITGSDNCTGTDALAQLAVVDGETCTGTERELTAWPSDSDTATMTEAGTWSGPVIDGDGCQGTDAGETVALADTDTSSTADSGPANPVDVFTYVPAWDIGPGGGLLRIVWDGRVVWSGERETGEAHRLAAVLAASSEVRFLEDGDSCSGADCQDSPLGVSVTVSPVLAVSVEVRALTPKGVRGAASTPASKIE